MLKQIVRKSWLNQYSGDPNKRWLHWFDVTFPLQFSCFVQQVRKYFQSKNWFTHSSWSTGKPNKRGEGHSSYRASLCDRDWCTYAVLDPFLKLDAHFGHPYSLTTCLSPDLDILITPIKECSELRINQLQWGSE